MLQYNSCINVRRVQIVKQLDWNGDGAIDIKEFIAGTLSLYQVAQGGLPTQRMMWQNRLKVLFAELDRDGNGTISETELLAVFPNRQEVRKAIQVLAPPTCEWQRTQRLALCIVP